MIMNDKKRKYNIAIDCSLKPFFYNGYFLSEEEVMEMGYDGSELNTILEIAFPFIAIDKITGEEKLHFFSKKKVLWVRECEEGQKTKV